MVLPTIAGDSYLFWMLDEREKSNFWGVEFYAASLKVDLTTGQYLQIGSNFDEASAWGDMAYANGVDPEKGGVGTVVGPYWANIPQIYAKAGNSFVLELYAEDGRLLAHSDPIAYQVVEKFATTDPWNADFRPTSPFTDWQVVPEPTSGLLVLLGMAGLALRRKRA